MMRGLPADLRYTVRSLGRSPGFALAVVLTLTIGVGANTAAFSLVRGILLRALAASWIPALRAGGSDDRVEG
jgi:hypothetical protein